MTDMALPPEAQQLLAQLHDITPPPPVSWWPPAPGWWLLAGLSLALLVWGGITFLAHKRRNRYRHQACSELSRLTGTETNPLCAQISELLKRTALTAYPEQHTSIANSFGDAWVALLNQTCPGTPFTGDTAKALAQGPYQPNIRVAEEPLRAAALHWIKHHHRHFVASLATGQPGQEVAHV